VEPYQIEVLHPDAFLMDRLDLALALVVDELARQAAANRCEPRNARSRDPAL